MLRHGVVMAPSDLAEEALRQLVGAHHGCSAVALCQIAERYAALIGRPHDPAAARLPAAHHLDGPWEDHYVPRSV